MIATAFKMISFTHLTLASDLIKSSFFCYHSDDSTKNDKEVPMGFFTVTVLTAVIGFVILLLWAIIATLTFFHGVRSEQTLSLRHRQIYGGVTVLLLWLNLPYSIMLFPLVTYFIGYLLPTRTATKTAYFIAIPVTILTSVFIFRKDTILL